VVTEKIYNWRFCVLVMGRKMPRSNVLAQRRIRQSLDVALGRGDDRKVVELCRSYKSQREIADIMDYRFEFSLGGSSAGVLVHSIIEKSDLIGVEEYKEIKHSVVSRGATSTLVERGLVPWSPGEEMFAYAYYISGVYTHREIGEKLGNVFGKVRPEGSVRNHIYQLNRKRKISENY